MEPESAPQNNRIACALISALVGVCLLCISIYGLAAYLPNKKLHDNIEKWQAKGISTYRITVIGWVSSQYRNTVYVRNGKLILETNPYPGHELREGPIDAFFQELSRCTGPILGCSVEYNPDFGYPTKIDWPCLDACPVFETQLIDLKLNLNIESF